MCGSRPFGSVGRFAFFIDARVCEGLDRSRPAAQCEAWRFCDVYVRGAGRCATRILRATASLPDRSREVCKHPGWRVPDFRASQLRRRRDILVRPVKQDLGHAPSLRHFSKLCDPEELRCPRVLAQLSAVRRWVSAELERSIAGESFNAHVNQQRLEGLRQLVCHGAVSSASSARAR